MPVYFLSDAPWEALICSPPSGNGGASQWNYARNSAGLRGGFYYNRGQKIDVPHDTEIKPRICENAYNESHPVYPEEACVGWKFHLISHP
jgi:hypothetical protein